MRLWRTRSTRAAYSRLVAEVAEHDVVHAAEEIVGTAWMAGLVEAEGQAAAAQRVCMHMRDTAYEIYRSAESSRDTDRLNESYRELAASQQALGRIRDRNDGLRQFAEHERTSWAEASRLRAMEAVADRERLEQAARAAGLRETGFPGSRAESPGS